MTDSLVEGLTTPLTYVGTFPPTFVVSPWNGFGDAVVFDGVNRGDGSMGVYSDPISTAGLGAFTLECKIQRARLGVTEVFCAWLDLVDTSHYVTMLWWTSDNIMHCDTFDSTGADVAGLSSIAAVPVGLHDVAAVWDGANIRLFLDGVLQSTAALATLGVARSASVSAGRFKGISSDPNAPYPFQGTVDEVRLSKVARYVANYAPAVDPFVDDANTLGLWHFDLSAGSGTGYRDPLTNYRQADVPYRGLIETIPGIDMQRQDLVEVTLQDLNGVPVTALPGAFVDEVNWALNDAPTAKMHFSAYDPFIRSNMLLGQREVVIKFNDCPRNDGTGFPETWVGALNGSEGRPGAVSYDMDSLEEYLKTRIIETASLLYNNVEQFDIAWGVISTLQSGPNMDYRITASYLPSGVTRYRNYQRDQHPNCFDIIQAFTTILNGFDWEIKVDPTGLRQWTPYYPEKGSHRLDIKFEYNQEGIGNITDYDLKKDVRSLLTRAYATGGTDGIVRFEQSYEDLTGSSTYRVRSGTIADPQQNDLPWLLSEAEQAVRQRKDPSVDLTVKVNNYTVLPDYSLGNPLLGRIHTGDYYWVIIDDGANQVSMELRLITIKWTSDEVLELGLAVPVPRVG